MTDHLARTFKTQLASITLVPDRGGKFEVSVDGELLYSKLETKRFPENSEIEKLVMKKLIARPKA